MPQGLVSTPLVAKEEVVLYCFVPLEEIRHHPGLVTHDDLLWLCEDVAVIECSSHLFRFIGKSSPWTIITSALHAHSIRFLFLYAFDTFYTVSLLSCLKCFSIGSMSRLQPLYSLEFVFYKY